MANKVSASTIYVFCLLFFGTILFSLQVPAAQAERKVLVTTFPIYQIVRNVTEGREALEVDLMLPGTLGCPHDYTVTPQDMQKLAAAHILVINGLGMEAFLDAPLKRVNPGIIIIDSSAGIRETLAYTEGHHHEHHHHHHGHKHHDDHGHKHDHNHGHKHHDKHGHEQGHAHDHDHEKAHKTGGHSAHSGSEEHHHTEHVHDHGEINPHLFTSPRMTALLAMNIAAGLSRVDPEGATVYYRNASRYSEVMTGLAEEMVSLGKRLKNRRIVQPHSVFDYLAHDMGLEIVAVIRDHGREPSASEMMNLVKTIREEGAGAIFIEPQYPGKVGETLSRETGVPVAVLDPVATGPDNAPLEYYETVMRNNMKILESTLGVQH